MRANHVVIVGGKTSAHNRSCLLHHLVRQLTSRAQSGNTPTKEVRENLSPSRYQSYRHEEKSTD